MSETQKNENVQLLIDDNNNQNLINNNLNLINNNQNLINNNQNLTNNNQPTLLDVQNANPIIPLNIETFQNNQINCQINNSKEPSNVTTPLYSLNNICVCFLFCFLIICVICGVFILFIYFLFQVGDRKSVV